MPSADDLNVRALEDIKESEDCVRIYDGERTLYVYREENHHVIVSIGDSEQNTWTRTVLSKRSAVVPNERLWAIPDNWKPRLSIKQRGEDLYENGRQVVPGQYVVYQIVSSNNDVLIRQPHGSGEDELQYKVVAMGSLNVNHVEDIDWSPVEEAVSVLGVNEDDSGLVAEKLDMILNNRVDFERRLKAKVSQLDGIESVETEEEGLIESLLDNSIEVELSKEVQRTIFKNLITIFTETSEKENIEAEIMEVLKYSGMEYLTTSKVASISFSEGQGVPNWVYLRALIQGGYPIAGSVDYFMVEILGIPPQQWARERDVVLSSIENNVERMRRAIKE